MGGGGRWQEPLLSFGGDVGLVVKGVARCVMLRNCLEVLVASGRCNRWSFGGDVVSIMMGGGRCVTQRSCLEVVIAVGKYNR